MERYFDWLDDELDLDDYLDELDLDDDDDDYDWGKKKCHKHKRRGDLRVCRCIMLCRCRKIKKHKKHHC
ncbi:hypothetical protein HZI73_12970 [Vallitalea pronyensis]|uniref:Uncharacterized protein n=1 Tax=Vallitalea pronyensis TaxID=1348613 RepID=A0A8J8SH97_9FIRM|nr:hypothetical protein [Vallitalea pronyensis]QUI23143.1 hypothetical protein HZI73_12970 [Vallitalea pronyensis]